MTPDAEQGFPDNRATKAGVKGRGRRGSAIPGPVVIQRRSQAARYARASAIAVRIAVLLSADILVLLTDYWIADLLRSARGPSVALSGLLVELVPRGTLPRVEVVFAVLIGLALLGNYGPGPFRRSSGRLFAGSSLGMSLVFWSAIWDGVSPVGAVGFLLALLGLGTSLVFGRRVVDFLVTAVRPLRKTSRALFIGSADEFARIRESHILAKHPEMLVVGRVATAANPDAGTVGSANELLWLLEMYAIDTVLIADHIDEETLSGVLTVCSNTGCSAIAASPMYQMRGFVPRIVSKCNTSVVELYRPSLKAPQLAMKRAFDLVFASVLLAVLTPLLLLVAAAVAVTSKGPVIFWQDRIGYAGRRFRMYKFRTMVEDAEEQKESLRSLSLYSDERVFKIRVDPRITRFGRILRRTSIDELPQLWNVLRGEMSLVGPRPPLPSEVIRYDEHHYSRFDMKPGITGPWQVSGRSEITCFEDIIALDTAYLTDWTIARDFVLLVRTVPAVLSMRGAL